MLRRGQRQAEQLAASGRSCVSAGDLQAVGFPVGLEAQAAGLLQTLWPVCSNHRQPACGPASRPSAPVAAELAQALLAQQAEQHPVGRAGVLGVVLQAVALDPLGRVGLAGVGVGLAGAAAVTG